MVKADSPYCGVIAREHKCCQPPNHGGPHKCMPLCGKTWRTPETTDTTKDTK